MQTHSPRGTESDLPRMVAPVEALSLAAGRRLKETYWATCGYQRCSGVQFRELLCIAREQGLTPQPPVRGLARLLTLWDGRRAERRQAAELLELCPSKTKPLSARSSRPCRNGRCSHE